MITPLGVLMLDLMTLVLVGWTLDLVRRGRLYVGYGIIVIALLSGGAALATLPGLGTMASRVGRLVFPQEPLALLGYAFGAFVTIYVLHQLTVISNRLSRLTQELAIRGAGSVDETARGRS
jgi:hypothetical protein